MLTLKSFNRFLNLVLRMTEIFINSKKQQNTVNTEKHKFVKSLAHNFNLLIILQKFSYYI